MRWSLLMVLLFFMVSSGCAASATPEVVSIRVVDVPVQVVGDASLSADGNSVVFVGLDEQSKPQLYVVEVNGSGFRQLTFDVVKKWGPVWGEEGEIYYISHNRQGLEKIFVLRPDGSKQELIPGSTRQGKSAEDNPPAWGAPSYAKGLLAFTSFDEHALDKIFLAEANGSNPHVIRPGLVRQWNPSLSRDGEQVVFISHDENNWEQVFTMRVDGSDLRQLTFDNVKKSNPAWGPEGMISFVSFDNRSDHVEKVYVMHANGSDRQPLLPFEGSRQISLSWNAKGSRAVFVDKPIKGAVQLKVVDFALAPQEAETTPTETMPTPPTPTLTVTATPSVTATPVITSTPQMTPEMTVAPEPEPVETRSLVLMVGLLFAVFFVLLGVLYRVL